MMPSPKSDDVLGVGATCAESCLCKYTPQSDHSKGCLKIDDGLSSARAAYLPTSPKAGPRSGK